MTRTPALTYPPTYPPTPQLPGEDLDVALEEMDGASPPAVTSAVAGKDEDDEDEASELNANTPLSPSTACDAQTTYSSLDIKKMCKKLLVRR